MTHFIGCTPASHSRTFNGLNESAYSAWMKPARVWRDRLDEETDKVVRHSKQSKTEVRAESFGK